VKTYDVCIAGAGGVVGLAIAREAALKGHTVAAIEKHSAPGKETSGRNSRVIHSGFHERQGSLKAKFALRGSALIVEYARNKGVPLLRTGMLIAVPRGAVRQGLWRETHALCNAWFRGRATGVPFRFVFSSSGIRRFAAVNAIGGIFIPSVHVIDVESFMAAMEQDAASSGAEFFYGREIRDIRADGSAYLVATSMGEFRTRILVNTAGLHASRISIMAGGPGYPIEFLRGDYYEIAGGVARWNISTLVYPAMPPRAPSKGIHFSPRTDGRLFIGPNACRVQEPGAYEEQPSLKPMFMDAARRFLPEIRDTDLRWAYCGIRPKLALPDGKDDFVIRLDRQHPPLINVIGIDSPGLSASLAIGEYVEAMLQRTGILA
jgi:glycerol-3-phosphate dehydrogenase